MKKNFLCKKYFYIHPFVISIVSTINFSFFYISFLVRVTQSNDVHVIISALQKIIKYKPLSVSNKYTVREENTHNEIHVTVYYS